MGNNSRTWSPAEDEVVLRPQLDASQAAVLLERTVSAVRGRRAQLKRSGVAFQYRQANAWTPEEESILLDSSQSLDALVEATGRSYYAVTVRLSKLRRQGVQVPKRRADATLFRCDEHRDYVAGCRKCQGASRARSRRWRKRYPERARASRNSWRNTNPGAYRAMKDRERNTRGPQPTPESYTRHVAQARAQAVRHHAPWTAGDLALLHSEVSNFAAALALRRTLGEVVYKRRTFRNPPRTEQRWWTADEDTFLLNHLDDVSSGLARDLGRTVHQVKWRKRVLRGTLRTGLGR